MQALWFHLLKPSSSSLHESPLGHMNKGACVYFTSARYLSSAFVPQDPLSPLPIRLCVKLKTQTWNFCSNVCIFAYKMHYYTCAILWAKTLFLEKFPHRWPSWVAVPLLFSRFLESVLTASSLSHLEDRKNIEIWHDIIILWRQNCKAMKEWNQQTNSLLYSPLYQYYST